MPLAKFNVDAIDMNDFYENYVRTRQPCIIHNLSSVHCTDYKSWLSSLSDLKFATKVQVEPLNDQTKTFGTGIVDRQHIQISDVMQKLKDNKDLYLTTQYSANDSDSDDDVKRLLPSPVGDFIKSNRCPLVPWPISNRNVYLTDLCEFKAQLVLESVNAWIGSTSGTSSGLHHDFHDNLYIVAAGRKRFTLISPLYHESLYTHGKVLKMHNNNTIVYEGDGAEFIRSDGADTRDVLAKKTSEKYDSDNSVDEEQLVNDSDDSDIDWNVPDSFEECDNYSDDDPAHKKRKTSPDHPPSFSKVPVNVLYHYLVHSHGLKEYSDSLAVLPPPPTKRDLYKFKKLKNIKVQSVILEAGDMLYLPAGYFHEVTSYRDDSSEMHVAFNYWFHPPACGSTLQEDDFWMGKFKETLKKMQRDESLK